MTGALFIHGTASSGRIWARLLRELRTRDGCDAPETVLGGPILTPDTPGMGDSRLPPDRPLTFEHWLGHLRQVATEGNPERLPIHLVGHSLGSALAIHLAQEPWVESVTLVAPATKAYCEHRRSVSRIGSNPGSIMLPGHLGQLVSKSSALSRDDARALREDYVKAEPLLSMGIPWPPFLMNEAHYLRGKRVLLIYGEDDAIVPSQYFTRLRDELKGASVDVGVKALPGCGHIPQVERAVEVAGLLQEFWASMPQPDNLPSFSRGLYL